MLIHHNHLARIGDKLHSSLHPAIYQTWPYYRTLFWVFKLDLRHLVSAGFMLLGYPGFTGNAIDLIKTEVCAAGIGGGYYLILQRIIIT